MRLIRVTFILLFISGPLLARHASLYLLAGQSNAVGQGDWFKDNVHYNQDALNEIGTKTAEFIYSKTIKAKQ